MIKETNTRIIITMSKQQAAWLHKTAKKLKMSVSKLCKWLMEKNIAKMLTYITEEERKVLMKLAKTPWINLYDEDGEKIEQPKPKFDEKEQEIIKYLMED